MFPLIQNCLGILRHIQHNEVKLDSIDHKGFELTNVVKNMCIRYN